MLFNSMAEDEMHVSITVYYTIQICHIQIIQSQMFNFALNRSLMFLFFVK